MYSPGEITDTSLPHSSLLGKECEFFKWCDQLKKEDTIDRPICMCEAGLCRIDGDFFVCPIKRGHGACSFKISLEDSSKQADETNSSSQSTLKKEDIIVRPICECEAGPCRIDGNFFVCPIKRGQGACSFKISLEDSSKQADETKSSPQSTLKKEDIIVPPICECEAGPCRIDFNFFVCPIKRGQGACNFKISLEDSSKSKRMEQIVLRARL